MNKYIPTQTKSVSSVISTEFSESMKMKIPRKKKKVLKRNCVIDTFMVMKFNWHFNKRMVIVNNYINAGIAINLTNEDKNYIKNGLLNNPRFNNYFI